MEIPKHTCLAVPSVQIQLLIGLQLWSEKEGQSLSRLKAQGFTGHRHECLAGAFPSISESSACKGQRRVRPGPQIPSPPVIGKPQAAILHGDTVPSARSSCYSPGPSTSPLHAGSRTCCSSPHACWRPSAMLAPTATTTLAALASTWTSTLTSKETPWGDTSTATCWRRWALLPRPWAGGLHTGLSQGDQAEPSHYADSPGPGAVQAGTDLL